MDERFVTLLEAQRVQSPLALDTSWLHVAHVDETVSFVKVDSPRGWALVANDPRLARLMLEEAEAAGHGDVPMFVGKTWLDDERDGSAETTVADVLADPDLMAASAEAAVEVDAQVAVLKEATGLADDEIIRVPFLHTNVFGKSLAYQPATVNGVVLADSAVALPDPHGPIVEGRDIFREQLTEAFGEYGITVHFVEDWDAFHRNNGEVHCATNVIRQPPTDPYWWEVDG
jgi:protein-arginine deiminase